MSETSTPVWSDTDEFLRYKVLKGFHERGFPTEAAYTDRITHEGQIICQTGYTNYFLIVADLTDFMRRSKIPFLVRGSGCGSVYVWGTGISHPWLDPVKYSIPFERFLNPARVSMPDIDMDIADNRRQEVFDYTVQKYGTENVARIISFGTMAAKAAIKDAFRAMDIPDYQHVSEKVCAAIPGGKVKLSEAIEASELLKEMSQAYPQVFAMARRIEGKVRQASAHAAGVVIAPAAMTQFMPCYFDGNPADRDPADWQPTTQWDMYDCEKRGLLKMDYLGLKTLRVVDQAVKYINEARTFPGGPFNVDAIDRKDDITWKMIAEGRLSGIFQVERSYVREFARRMNMGIKDEWQLAVILSIIRPGMMDANMTEVYLNRASGKEQPVPLHPAIADTLKNTYQVMVFQEDLMRVAQKLAGFSMSEADELRRAVGKKLPEEMAKVKPKFIEGCVKTNHLALDQAEQVWSLIEPAGRYLFCAGHAAAYGLVLTYQTSFLKANYPLEYMTALINSEAGVGNSEQGYNSKPAEYIQEAKNMGITIEKPNIRTSGAFCTPDLATNTIRYGLSMIKGVSESAVAWIVQNCRDAVSFKDFLLRCYECYQEPKPDGSGLTWKNRSRIGKGHIEALIAAGAFDHFDGRTADRDMLNKLATDIQERIKKYWDQECKRRNGSTRLKVQPEDVKQTIDDYIIEDYHVEHLGLEAILKAEKAVTGCYLSDDPFNPFIRHINQFPALTYAQIKEGDYGEGIFPAVLRDFREITVKNGKSKGRQMAFITWIHAGGDVESVCFSDTWEAAKQLMPNTNMPIVERGKVYMVTIRPDQGGKCPIVKSISRLSGVNAMAA